jgi:hypothetical protein
MLIGASTVLAIFFSIFVMTMMCDQWEGAVTNTTQIESMKMWKEESRDILTGLEDVFGEPPSLSWLLPTPLKARYAWSPLDDPDAWDKRDPHIIQHFQRVKEQMEQRKVLKGLPPPASQPLIPQLREMYLQLVGLAPGKDAPPRPAAATPVGGDGVAAAGGGEQNAEGGSAKGGTRRRRPANES